MDHSINNEKFHRFGPRKAKVLSIQKPKGHMKWYYDKMLGKSSALGSRSLINIRVNETDLLTVNTKTATEIKIKNTLTDVFNVELPSITHKKYDVQPKLKEQIEDIKNKADSKERDELKYEIDLKRQIINNNIDLGTNIEYDLGINKKSLSNTEMKDKDIKSDIELEVKEGFIFKEILSVKDVEAENRSVEVLNEVKIVIDLEENLNEIDLKTEESLALLNAKEIVPVLDVNEEALTHFDVEEVIPVLDKEKIMPLCNFKEEEKVVPVLDLKENVFAVLDVEKETLTHLNVKKEVVAILDTEEITPVLDLKEDVISVLDGKDVFAVLDVEREALTHLDDKEQALTVLDKEEVFTVLDAEKFNLLEELKEKDRSVSICKEEEIPFKVDLNESGVQLECKDEKSVLNIKVEESFSVLKNSEYMRVETEEKIQVENVRKEDSLIPPIIVPETPVVNTSTNINGNHEIPSVNSNFIQVRMFNYSNIKSFWEEKCSNIKK